MPNKYVLPYEHGFATKVKKTKKKSIVAARDIARSQGSELIIHDKDGKFRSIDSQKRPFP
ncbi:DUF2188 domain-containing protein [Paenibacillus sp. GM2]|uniref:DUF2188 domain-containing protein n=1 Tax=Paenibacillus sp. GM2 TaxID=1622070 RepID=UPI00083984C7|nr:DUF2188 domain-containing protein [Paenibacillus sp. GM2]